MINSDCSVYKKTQLVNILKEKTVGIIDGSKYKKQRICNILEMKTKCGSLGGYINTNNSCFFTSFLVGMLHFENIFTQFMKLTNSVKSKKLKDLETEILILLKNVSSDLYNGKKIKCNLLRKSFQEYDDIYYGKDKSTNWLSEQLEPLDIIFFLSRIYSIPNTIEYKHTVYS